MRIRIPGLFRASVSVDGRAGRGTERSATRYPGRIRRSWGSKILPLLTLGIGILGLARFASQVGTRNPRLAFDDRPDSGIFLRSEVLDIWLPQTFVELASHQARTGELRTHDELQRFLEVRGQGGLWYAVTIRGYQAEGRHEDLTEIRWPQQGARDFPEFLAILSALAEDQPTDPANQYSTASFHVLPQALIEREPREVMAELLCHPNAGSYRNARATRACPDNVTAPTVQPTGEPPRQSR
jgi:hypothetical protein